MLLTAVVDADVTKEHLVDVATIQVVCQETILVYGLS